MLTAIKIVISKEAISALLSPIFVYSHIYHINLYKCYIKRLMHMYPWRFDNSFFKVLNNLLYLTHHTFPGNALGV